LTKYCGGGNEQVAEYVDLPVVTVPPAALATSCSSTTSASAAAITAAVRAGS